MQNPYYIELANIPGAVDAGYQTAFQQQAMRDQVAAQQAQKERAMQMQSDLSRVVNNPNSGASDYGKLMIAYPEMAERIKSGYDVLNADQQSTLLQEALQVDAAVNSGRQDIAASLLRQKADAIENSGDAEKAKLYRTKADIIEKSPLNIARGATTAPLIAIIGADKYKAMMEAQGISAEMPYKTQKAGAEAIKATTEAQYSGLGQEADLSKKIADTENTYSMIEERGKRLGFDIKKAQQDYDAKLKELKQTGTKLSGEAEKLVNESAANSITAENMATKANALAARLDARSGEWGTGGLPSTISQMITNVPGWKTELTRMRAEYSSIVTPAAMAAYKKVSSGTTSDRDIETALKGVPSDNDKPERLAEYLRGVAKLQKYSAAIDDAKTKWVSDVGHLGKAKEDIVINGIEVPAGTGFTDYAEKYIQQNIGTGTDTGAGGAVPSGASYAKYSNYTRQ